MLDLAQVEKLRRAYRRETLDRYPEKQRARRLLKDAVRAGRLVRPDACSSCGATGVPIHGHHWDYDLPIDVIWLCSSCHGLEHREAPRPPWHRPPADRSPSAQQAVRLRRWRVRRHRQQRNPFVVLMFSKTLVHAVNVIGQETRWRNYRGPWQTLCRRGVEESDLVVAGPPIKATCKPCLRNMGAFDTVKF